MTTTNTTIDTPVAPVIDIAALGKVAVLQGGTSAERPISLLSGAGVLEALRSRGVDAHAFDPAERDLAEAQQSRHPVPGGDNALVPDRANHEIDRPG